MMPRPHRLLRRGATVSLKLSSRRRLADGESCGMEILTGGVCSRRESRWYALHRQFVSRASRWHSVQSNAGMLKMVRLRTPNQYFSNDVGQPAHGMAAEPVQDFQQQTWSAPNHEMLKILTGKGRYKNGQCPTIQSRYARYRCVHC